MDNLLLDAIKREFQLKNDAAVAKFVGVPRQLISTIRTSKASPPDSLILKMHKTTKWPVSAIEALIGTKETV